MLRLDREYKFAIARLVLYFKTSSTEPVVQAEVFTSLSPSSLLKYWKVSPVPQ